MSSEKDINKEGKKESCCSGSRCCGGSKKSIMLGVLVALLAVIVISLIR